VINKTRLAFFGSSSSFISSIIYKALVKELKNRDDIELVVIIDAVKDDFKSRIMRQDFLTTLIRWLALRLQGHKFKWRYYGAIKGTKIKDINTAECYRLLNLNHVDAILSVACPQIFGDVLLGYYYCVNYHNSLLPKYRGVCSTQWECYLREDRVGYTFHRMIDKFDCGNILIQQGLLEMHPTKYDSVIELDAQKAGLACRDLPDLLSTLSIHSYNGKKQSGIGSCYNQHSLDLLSLDEDTLRCFGWTAFPWYYVPKFARRWVK